MAPHGPAGLNVTERSVMSHLRSAGRRLRLLSGISLGAAAALTAAGCSSSSSVKPDLTSLTVGVAATDQADSVGLVPFEVGQSQHTFNADGISVTVKQFSSETQEEQALAAGSIDVAYGSYAEFLSADPAAGSATLADKGAIRVLDDAYDAGANSVALLVPRGGQAPKLSTAQNNFCVGDYTIAVPGTFTEEYLALFNWMNSQNAPINMAAAPGISPIPCPSVDVVDTEQEALAVVAAGHAQAAVVEEPYITAQEIGQGWEVAEDLTSGVTASMPMYGFFATASFTEKYPNTTTLFTNDLVSLQAQCAERTVVEHAMDANASAQQQNVVASMNLGSYPQAVLATSVEDEISLMQSAGMIGAKIMNSGSVMGS